MLLSPPRGMDRGNAVDEFKLAGLHVEGECKSKTPPEDEVGPWSGRKTVPPLSGGNMATCWIGLWFHAYLLPFFQCPILCDSVHASVHERENSPMMRASRFHVTVGLDLYIYTFK